MPIHQPVCDGWHQLDDNHWQYNSKDAELKIIQLADGKYAVMLLDRHHTEQKGCSVRAYYVALNRAVGIMRQYHIDWQTKQAYAKLPEKAAE